MGYRHRDAGRGRAAGHRAPPGCRHDRRHGRWRRASAPTPRSSGRSRSAPSTSVTPHSSRAIPIPPAAPSTHRSTGIPCADYKFAVVAGGRPSVTHYETVEAFRAATLLDIHLETGRTHQIRVHMAAVRHPCVGDLTYGADPVLAQRLGLTRQWLHARELGFEHPGTGEWLRVDSPFPADLQHALDVLRDESLSRGWRVGPRHAGSAPLLVASNRGPLTVVAVEDGDDEIRRGGGGLVSGMQAALSSHAGRGVGLRRDERPRAHAGPAGRARPAVRARRGRRRAARRLRRPDAADRRGDVPRRLQRRRQLHALVRAAPPVRPADAAELRRVVASPVGPLRPVQPGLRRRARRGGRRGRDGDGAGLPPVPRPADAARAAPGRADRQLHAHAVGDAGRLRDAARRRRRRRSSTACSAQT